ncbi:MAG: type II secretion system protein GspG [Planctomycetes bacterium]|nr:type II secretion system protein GspG [Planctomycetota bacterium]
MNPSAFHRARGSARGTAGFTLIEVMVVVVILGLLAALIVPNVINSGDRAREQAARIDCESIASATRLFVVDHGRLPALDELVYCEANDKSYVEHIGTDPWGHEYTLRPGDRRDRFEVRSAGPNGAFDDDDDVIAQAGPRAR